MPHIEYISEYIGHLVGQLPLHAV